MIVKNYLKLENEIAEAEASNPLHPLEAKMEQLSNISEEITKLEVDLEKLDEQTKDFGVDEKDEIKTHKFFVETGVTADSLSPEQQQKLDLINKHEIVQKKLNSYKNQNKELKKELSKLEKKAHFLQGLYHQQDDLLDDIFEGKYGSLLENQLEVEVDQLEFQRSRILEANYKWRQAQVLIEHSCKQLSAAVTMWKNLRGMQREHLNDRYAVGANVRNNLVAASQNASQAHQILPSVEFPYILRSEVETLDKAAQYVFVDMQHKSRYETAERLFTTTYMRASALIQWFDMVLNNTIMKDLSNINEKVKDRVLKLRRERVKLIKEKVQEMYGEDIDLNETLRGRDITAMELAKANISDQNAIKTEGQEKMESADRARHLMDKDSLAPVPSKDVLFGGQYENLTEHIKNLQDEHKKEMEIFMKGQEQNASRRKNKLEEKLMIKRQRRARLKLEEKQLQALSD